MGKIICVASHKGGVGKTTTALNLGFSLSRFGQRVLLVDADPQGAMAIASNLKKRTDKGLVNLLRGDAKPGDVVITTKDKTLGVVGVGADRPEDVFHFEAEARKGSLARVIRAISDGYDYTFIDAPAGIGSLTTSLLGASAGVLLPLTCRAITVKTLPAFLKLTQKIRGKINPDLRLEGLVATMYEHTEAEAEMLSELRADFPPSVFFETVIPFDDSFERASLRSVPVGMIPGADEAARAYMDLAMELKTRELNEQQKGKTDEDVEGLL